LRSSIWFSNTASHGPTSSFNPLRIETGSVPSGGGAFHEEGARKDAGLEGDIEVSADIAASQITAVQRSLGDAGAIRVSGR
jgi:hypothetical protein